MSSGGQTRQTGLCSARGVTPTGCRGLRCAGVGAMRNRQNLPDCARPWQRGSKPRISGAWRFKPAPGPIRTPTTTRVRPACTQIRAEGVVDADGRVHAMNNLYVTGASLFPTAGFANPVLTIVALALPLGDHLKARVRNAGGSTHEPTMRGSRG